ncbi:cyclin-dependent kinase 1-like [Haliotis rufescens]|uniref:cyclin-dependent kinase 1-like n=1 Tax=Haliotis rufescens TaxID=6454 RepID=UPI00201EB153|nr:cyclin-dependent kinase 1-like [Haliotis rufescens]
MVEFWIASSSLLAGAYVAWKGYSWFRRKPKQVVRWEVIPPVTTQGSIRRTSDSSSRSSTTGLKSSCHRAGFSDPFLEVSSRVPTASSTRGIDSNRFRSIKHQTNRSALNKDSLGRIWPHVPSRVQSDPTLASGEPAKETKQGLLMEEDFTDMYEILSRVGRGTFGSVYKAMKLDSLDIVAVKRVRHEGDVDNALTEVDILKSLQDCPNIVRLLDCFQLESEIIIIMNLASGSLKDVAIGHRDSEYIMSLFLDIQSAVGFLHDKLIAHRDLKPANVLLEGNKAILADFGCAKNVQGFYGKEVYITSTAGTYAYMAPEVLSNVRLYSAIKADVWSLGCIIYYLLTGEDLFIGECVELTVVEHAETVVELPEFVDVSAITSSLGDSMKAALQFDPANRPPAFML